MNINEVSIKTGISKDMIRYYEKIDLIHPRHLDNGYRDYTSEDIYQLVTIKQYSTLGIKLKTLHSLLKFELIDKAQTELQQAIVENQTALQFMQEKISFGKDMEKVLQMIQQNKYVQFNTRKPCYFYPNVSSENQTAQYVKGGVFKPMFRIGLDQLEKSTQPIESGMLFLHRIKEIEDSFYYYPQTKSIRTIVSIPVTRNLEVRDYLPFINDMRANGFEIINDCLGYKIMTANKNGKEMNLILLSFPIQ